MNTRIKMTLYLFLNVINDICRRHSWIRVAKMPSATSMVLNSSFFIQKNIFLKFLAVESYYFSFRLFLFLYCKKKLLIVSFFFYEDNIFLIKEKVKKYLLSKKY